MRISGGNHNLAKAALVDRSLKVLVVDDFRTMSKIMTAIFRQLGISNVEAVHTGSEALGRMRDESYDLILCDLEMQPMDGLELVRNIRADKRLTKTKIILMTGNHERVSKMIADGQREADGYILKPFKAEALRAKLEQVLSAKPIVA